VRCKIGNEGNFSVAARTISRREGMSYGSSPDGTFMDFRTKVILKPTIIVQVQPFKKMTNPWVFTIFTSTSRNNK